eukprot:COSAG06_NODE_2387_length_6967_cov_99.192046_1_plen_69_part_00
MHSDLHPSDLDHAPAQNTQQRGLARRVQKRHCWVHWRHCTAHAPVKHRPLSGVGVGEGAVTTELGGCV